MKVEITYNNGETFTAYLTNETYENVMACLLDDVSVSIDGVRNGDWCCADAERRTK